MPDDTLYNILDPSDTAYTYQDFVAFLIVIAIVVVVVIVIRAVIGVGFRYWVAVLMFLLWVVVGPSCGMGCGGVGILLAGGIGDLEVSA